MRYLTLIIISILLTSFNNNKLKTLNKDASEYTIDEIFVKIELESGTLDEDGDEIDFIFTKGKIKQGKYEISITDGPGDLYEIKGTNYFLEFIGHYGYAGYGDEGLLVINSYGMGKFIKYDD